MRRTLDGLRRRGLMRIAGGAFLFACVLAACGPGPDSGVAPAPVSVAADGDGETGADAAASGPDSFETQPRPAQPIVEGFALSISKPNASTVLVTWADQGITNYQVWTSSDPYFAPGDPGSSEVASGSDESFSTSAGTEAYYRVVASGAAVELSTTVGQLEYTLYEGYTKLGSCLVSQVNYWPELQADMPSGPSQGFMWDPEAQDWVYGYFIEEIELGPGQVISVLHDDEPSPDSYVWVGHVPTASDFSITLLPGDNLVTTVPLRFGELMASELLAQVEAAERIGSWDPATQTLRWHPDDGDWLLPTCSPVHVEVSAPSEWPPPPVDDLPPDPSEVAPPLDTTVSTRFIDAVSFLYENDPPVQDGVAPGTIQPARAAVLRGQVVERDGDPLAGVLVSVLGHEEYGSTLTRADGFYDLAVNGGGPLVLSFTTNDMLPAQRTVDTGWQDYVFLDRVALVAHDPEVSLIEFVDPIEYHVASTSIDANGSRAAVVMFREGTTATMVLPDHSETVLESISVRATEYTIGAQGAEAMPGTLPPSSAYTYAVEYSVDEAEAAGAVLVAFEPSAVSYVDNFLDFPVGGVVPVGTYDRERGAWIPALNGLVVAVVGETAGRANLDLTGDGTADPGSYAGVGITDDEREALATLYGVGEELWRLELEHFSPKDCNWPWGVPDDGEPPPRNRNPPDPQPDPRPCEQPGSVIECQGQVLGESIPIAGTGLSLNYRSDRVPGRTDAYTLSIDATPGPLPTSLQEVRVRLQVAGRALEDTLPALLGQTASLTWDGFDAYGRRPQGPVPAEFCLGYVYPGAYAEPGNATPAQSAFGLNGNGTVITYDADRFEATFWRCYGRRVVGGGVTPAAAGGSTGYSPGHTWNDRYSLGVFDARGSAAALGGWTLSAHHSLAPEAGVLYLGTGEQRSNPAPLNEVIGSIDLGSSASAQRLAFGPDGTMYASDGSRILRITPDGTISNFAGGGGSLGDNGPATSAQLGTPVGLDVGPDGSVFVASSGQHRVRRIGPDGTITTVAGNGTNGTGGDGGLATAAQVSVPSDVAVAPDGTLFILHALSPSRVRRVGPDGRIAHFAGAACTSGAPHGKRALGDCFFASRAMALSLDGSLYLGLREDSGAGGANRIYRITPSGVFELVAGGGSPPDGVGDGLLATQANVSQVQAIDVGPDGTIYFSEAGTNHHRVRVIGTNGIIRTLAGNGAASGSILVSDDGLPATSAFVSSPGGVARGPDGAIYIGHSGSVFHDIRRVSGASVGFGDGERQILSDNRNEIFVFDGRGRHLRTLDALTGSTVWDFGYDATGLLVSLTDTFGAETTIERDGEGQPSAIVSPEGHETRVTISSGGWLVSLTNPAGEAHAFEYDTGGLLTSFLDPRADESVYEYDNEGRLSLAQDPEGGAKTLARSELAGDGYEVTVTTALGRETQYLVERGETGGELSTVTDPAGLSTATLTAADGSSETTLPDGTVMETTLRADARFGFQVPRVASLAVATPGGRHFVLLYDSEVTQSDPSDPLSMTALTQTVNVNGNTWTSAWDSASDEVIMTSPEGREVLVGLDTAGLVASVEVADVNSVAIERDLAGRIDVIRSGAGLNARESVLAWGVDGFLRAATSPDGQETVYGHDLVGRVTGETRADLTNLFGLYDEIGNLSFLTLPSTEEHAFTSDSKGRLLSHEAPAIVGVSSSGFLTGYNLDHQVVEVVRPDQTSVEFTYGADTALLTSVSTLEGAYSFAYDSAGRLESLEDPDGGELTFTYDGHLLLAESREGEIPASVVWTYDDNFRISSEAVNAGALTTMTYDDDGLIVGSGVESIVRDVASGEIVSAVVNDSVLQITEDDFGDLFSLTVEVDGIEIFSQTASARDRAGRIVALVEQVAETERAVEYVYDAVGRLVEVSEDESVYAEYEYDTNGNRVHSDVESSVRDAVFDAQDRLETCGDEVFAHADNGERLSRENLLTSEVFEYEYDAFGQLRSVILPDSTEVSYVLDSRARRVGKRVDGVTQRGWVYGDALRVIAETDDEGVLMSRFVYGVWSDVPDYMVQAGTVYRIVSDLTGSVRLVVNASTGAIAQRIDYGPWGEVLYDSNPGFQPFGFAGGLYDPDTGLVRFGVRDYDASFGTWLSKDPIGFDGGDASLYAYAGNDPINFGDPSGLGRTKRATAREALAEALDDPRFKTREAFCWICRKKGGGWEYVKLFWGPPPPRNLKWNPPANPDKRRCKASFHTHPPGANSVPSPEDEREWFPGTWQLYRTRTHFIWGGDGEFWKVRRNWGTFVRRPLNEAANALDDQLAEGNTT